jgi:hypothetical protein
MSPRPFVANLDASFFDDEIPCCDTRKFGTLEDQPTRKADCERSETLRVADVDGSPSRSCNRAQGHALRPCPVEQANRAELLATTNESIFLGRVRFPRISQRD